MYDLTSLKFFLLQFFVQSGFFTIPTAEVEKEKRIRKKSASHEPNATWWLFQRGLVSGEVKVAV